jgi:hypothetical protein
MPLTSSNLLDIRENVCADEAPIGGLRFVRATASSIHHAVLERRGVDKAMMDQLQHPEGE